MHHVCEVNCLQVSVKLLPFQVHSSAKLLAFNIFGPNAFHTEICMNIQWPIVRAMSDSSVVRVSVAQEQLLSCPVATT